MHLERRGDVGGKYKTKVLFSPRCSFAVLYPIVA